MVTVAHKGAGGTFNTALIETGTGRTWRVNGTYLILAVQNSGLRFAGPEERFKLRRFDSGLGTKGKGAKVISNVSNNKK